MGTTLAGERVPVTHPGAQEFTRMSETGAPRDRLVDGLGSVVLFLVVALPMVYFGATFVWAAGIDNWIHKPFSQYGYATGELERLVPGIELVILPLAALAGAQLRWRWRLEVSDSLWLPLIGTGVVCTLMWGTWHGVPPLLVIPLATIAAVAARRLAPHQPRPQGRSTNLVESSTPWLPWRGAAVAVAAMGFLAWSWAPPQTLVGPSEFAVARWFGTAVVAGATYLGMIFFPRLTASLAGAVAGPALFAVVGYILFPSLMRDAQGHLADALVVASHVGATFVVTAALFMIAFSQRFRRHPLSYAVWTGALTFCLAVSGTFNGIDGIT